MTLTEVCRKYQINESFLSSKDDGLTVAAVSVQDLIRELKARNGDDSVIKKLERLAEFLREVKNSTY